MVSRPPKFSLSVQKNLSDPGDEVGIETTCWCWREEKQTNDYDDETDDKNVNKLCLQKTTFVPIKDHPVLKEEQRVWGIGWINETKC